MRRELFIDIFEEIETNREYNGYIYSVGQAVTIVVPGSLCGLKNVSQIHQWAAQYLPADRSGLTLAVDGKTVRSTEKMKGYESSLHIISAQLSELGVTLGSRSVDGKSNEIPAVQELLGELDIAGCLVVADAMNCQKDPSQKLCWIVSSTQTIFRWLFLKVDFRGVAQRNPL